MRALLNEMCHTYIFRFFMVGQTHITLQVPVFLLLRLVSSQQDLQQWTNITAHLLLKILLSRHQIVYSREGRVSRPQGMASTSAWILFYIFCLLPPWSLIGSALWKIGLMPAIDQVQFNFGPSWWLRG